jgi:thiol-disulfide isomerase/thioredoxin
MKKKLKIIISIIVLCLFAFLGYTIVDKINHKYKIADNIKIMPHFEYRTLNNKVFNNKNLNQKFKTVFVYFNTECDFCNEEAQMISHNIDKFENTQLLFVSFEEPQKINEFALKHELLNYNEVFFIYDSKKTFATTFDIKSLPCIVLYNEDKQLIEKIKGQTKVETILRKLGR